MLRGAGATTRRSSSVAGQVACFPMIGVLAAIALAVGLTGQGRAAEEQSFPFYPQAGRVVRDVTSAALSDALPRATARTGERVACSVQPSDGRLRAAGATAAATAG